MSDASSLLADQDLLPKYKHKFLSSSWMAIDVEGITLNGAYLRHTMTHAFPSTETSNAFRDKHRSRRWGLR
jgi:hypothetical protein